MPLGVLTLSTWTHFTRLGKSAPQLVVGFEGIAIVFNVRRLIIVRPSDCDHVEAPWVILETVFVSETAGGPCQPALFFKGDSLGGATAASRFHFDVHEGAVVDGDQVDLAVTNAHTPGQNSPTEFFEVTRSGQLAAVPEAAVPERAQASHRVHVGMP